MFKFIKGFMDYRFLLSELVKKGIRLKYRRSYLGILWSLLEPILTTIILTIVFTNMYHKGATFPLYIIIGRLLYTFFQNGTKGALTSIRKNSGMIKKVYVPKYLYPLSDILFNFVIFSISLIVIVFVDIYCKVMPTWRVIYFIPAVMILLIMTIGIGLILCTLSVFFRDVEYLWNVALMLIMYLSAIFYDTKTMFGNNKLGGMMVKLNPLYQLIDMCRASVLNERIHWLGVAYATGFAFASLIVGLVIFRKNQDKFILHI